MLRYLLIDDETMFLFVLKKRLEANHNDLEVIVAFGMRDGLKLYVEQDFDLLIVNISAEKESMRYIITTIRQSTPVPIVLISLFEHDEEIIQMYDSGVDCCIQKPINIDVVESFINSIHRRQTFYLHLQYERRVFPMNIQDDFMINPLYRTATIKGKNIKLSFREFDLLYYLACNAGIVLTPDQICRYIWETEDLYHSRAADRIYRLRKKIEPDPENPTYIQTVYGVGYKFCL